MVEDRSTPSRLRKYEKTSDTIYGLLQNTRLDTWVFCKSLNFYVLYSLYQYLL
jgi:hypothetical protein